MTAAVVPLAIAAQWPELLFLGLIGVIGLVLAAATHVAGASRGAATVSVPSRISPPAAPLVTATVHGRRTPLDVVVHINGVAHIADRVMVGYTGREPVDVRWRLPPLDRGEYEIGPVIARVVDPLELLRRDRQVAKSTRVTVHPRRHDVLPVPTALDPDRDGRVSSFAAPGGQAEDGVRPYQEGDDLRLIHVPQSRRRGTVMLRRLAVAQASAAIVVLDTGHASYVDDDAFEEATSFAASLVAASATGDRPVEMHTTTHGVLYRGAGPAAVAPALDALARIERRAASPGMPRLHCPTTTAGTFVVITGGLDPAVIGAATVLARRRGVAAVVAIGGNAPSLPATGRIVSADDASSAALRWNRLATGW